MAVKKIVLYQNNEAALREHSKPLPSVSRKTQQLIQDLKDTLAESDNGIGLAAPQIGVHKRVIIFRLTGKEGSDCEPGPLMALVNPVIEEAGDERPDFDGCLSFPGLYGETVRPHHVRVSGMNQDGEQISCTFDGFDAVVVHHEVDHLDGVLFIDRVESPDKLYRIGEDADGNPIRLPVAIP